MEPKPEHPSESVFSVHARYGSEVITVLEPDGEMRWETSTIYRLLGHRPEDVEGTDYDPGESKWFRFVHPEDGEKLLSAVAGCLATPGENPPVEYRIRHADGSWRWFESRGINLADDPQIAGVVVSTRDITDRKRAEAESSESERRLRVVAAGAPVILFALDSDGVFTLTEGKGLADLGASPGDYVGESVFDIYGTTPDMLCYIRRALCGEEVAATVRIEGFSYETRYSPVFDDGGEVSGAICVATDVTARRELEERLAYQATHDPLTGVANRVLFEERLERALSRASRPEGLALLFIDLDDFKPVNDGNGHDAGDELLVAVAGRLEASLRPEGTVCRLGGDEFVVLLEDVDRGTATEIAERVAVRLHEPFELGSSGREIQVTTSLGIALAEPGSAGRYSSADLLREADAAMYRAKRSGKARYELSVLDA